MAISLLDIKNKKKRIDEINTTVNPTVTVSNSTSPQQTISLADIRNGKITISPVITEEDKEKITNAVNTVSNKMSNSLNMLNNEDKKQKENLVKLTEKNAKQKREEFEQSSEIYQKALSEEYKKRGVSFGNPFQEFNDKVTIENRDKRIQPNLADSNDVQDALRSVEEERQQAEKARLESNLADYLVNVAKVENEDVNLWDKTGGNVVRGIADLGSFINPSDREYVDENGNKVYLPTYNELKQQKVSENYDTGIGKLLGDSAYNISKILGSTAINSVVPGVGTATYWGDMFTDNYTSAINEGYDKGNALLYSTIGTGSEYLTGKFLGSATKGLTGGKTSELSKAISGATSKLIKNPQIANIIGNAGSEATEEFIQEYIGNINRLAVLENSTNAKDYLDVFKDEDVLKDALYSAGVGAISGGVTNIADSLNRNTNNNTDILNNFKTQLEESKANTTDKTKIETFDKAINLVDNYLSNVNANVQNNIQEIDNKNNINTDNSFSKQVDEFVNGTFNKQNHLTVLEHTPDVLQKLGVKDNPITLTANKLDRIMNKTGKQSGEYHDLGIDIVKQLPNAIENPLDVVKSHNNSYVLTTSLSDNQNRQVIVSIKIDGKGYVDDIKIDSNVMTSAYGRNNYDNWMANHQRNGDIVYDIDRGILNKKRGNVQGLQLPNEVTSSTSDITENTNSFSNDNIPQIGRNVKNGTSSNNINMQNNENNTQRTTDSSFSFDKTARRYNDLQQAARIDYTATSDGDINTIMYDKDGNLINQIALYDKNMANKEYGNQIGDYLFSNSTKKWQTINLNNSNENTNNANDYFMDHRPTETGLTADDLTNQNVEYTIPTDVYEHPEMYFMMNEKATQESMSVLNKVRNNPNAKVTIYRATTGNEINKGDWVTLSKTYAEEHNDRQFDGKGNIVSKEVSVKDIQYAGDDINEFGYFPKNDNKSNSKTELNENKQEDVLTIKQDDNNVTNETLNNSNGDGESKFYRNITERSEFLTQENRDKLSKEDYIKHYDTVSNEESMNKALDRLNEGGEAELNRWFAKGTDNKAFSNLQTTWDSTDVAEGWILLKRAQDNGDYDMMVEVAKKMREIGTKSGQAVQMYNLLARLTPEGMVKYATSELDEAWKIASKNKSKEWVDKYSEDFQLTPEETEYIVNQMQKVEKMPDGRAKTVEIAKVQKMLQDKLPPIKGQGIKSWMRISMLLNPKTQVRNVLGNAVIAPVNTVADTFAAIADRQIAKKTGVRTTGNTNIKNYAKGFKKGLVESYEDFKLGVNTRNIQGNRFEIGEGKSFNENHKGILSKPRNAISKGFNRLDSLLSFVLDAGDRGFYEASFVNSINNQMTLNKTNEVTQDMIDVATNEALSRTWQDNNNYTKFVLDIRRGMNKVSAKGYGLGDVLIPFAKTPANLTKAIVDYSPVGLLKTLASDARKLSNNIKTGTVTTEQQHRFVQNLGKATAGTMLYVAGMALAQAGITSGANDDDKDVSDFMKNTLGIQPYSIKIGNHTFTYDWAQPVAAPFAITADISRALNSDDVALKDAITTSLDSGFNILLEQSFLSGIQNVLNTSYGSTTENIIDEVLGLPARAVPTFVKQINDMIDPKTRMTFENGKQLESAKNQVKTKIPGLSDELPVKRDTLGREIEKYGGENNIFNIFFNPANISKGKVSESAKEIYDVYQATKDKTIMPRSAPNELSMTITNKKGEKKKKELSLDNKDKSEFLKISGGIIDKNVKKLKDNKYYKKLDDDEKALVIKEIVDYSYNKAKADLLDIDMSEVSGYKTVTKKLKGGMALYDYYAQEIYKNR